VSAGKTPIKAHQNFGMSDRRCPACPVADAHPSPRNRTEDCLEPVINFPAGET